MISKNAKIYIAGHNGLVGSSILRKFQKEGYYNFLLKSHSELDLTNQSAVEIFFKEEKPEYVILAAAKVGGIMANISAPADFLYQNLMIENNVINSAKQNNVKKLLFLASSCAYPREAPQPMKEEYLLEGKVEPTNEGYAIAKIVGLKMCQMYNTQYGTDYISVMPCNIYGINDNFDPVNSHVVPALIRKFHKAKMAGDESVTIWGTGNARRELLFTDDLADACFFLMSNYSENDFLNIGSGVDVSIKELAMLVKEVVGFSGKIKFDTSKPDGMPQKLMDVSNIKNLGWSPKVSLIDGLRKTYDWYIQNLINE